MGDVVRFARPAAEKLPHPDTVPALRPMPGEDAHSFCARIMRLWTVEAERLCGLPWAIRVLENQIAYLKARELFNARNSRKRRQWKLLQQAPHLRALANIRLSPRPAPRRRHPLRPS